MGKGKGKMTQGNHEHNVNIVIETTQGNWQGEFSKTLKVSELISDTVKHFSFVNGGSYHLKLASGETMRPERTLVSYHLADGDHLTFVDLGSAA